jgi:hypothetical protein
MAIFSHFAIHRCPEMCYFPSSHCRGQGFDSPQLHQPNYLIIDEFFRSGGQWLIGLRIANEL